VVATMVTNATTTETRSKALGLQRRDEEGAGAGMAEGKRY